MNKMFVCVIVAWISSSLGFQGVASVPSYDGKWWLSIDAKQREGFADGYISCFGFDSRNKIKFEYTSQVYAPKVSDYLLNHPDEQVKTVEELLWIVTKPPYAPPTRRNGGKPSGSPTNSKYGVYDGEFWREIATSTQLGFVQGFLYCYPKYDGTQGSFSKPAAEYVGAISKWYEIDGEGGINLHKMAAKIPEVLFKFRDADSH